MPGCEPWSHVAGSSVGVLVVHGFTGTPASVRGIAEALAAAGYDVELPRLPGHGTTVEDMLTTAWTDWSGEVERRLQRLAHARRQGRRRRPEHGRHAGAACRARSPGGRRRWCCINPLTRDRDAETMAMIDDLLDDGIASCPARGPTSPTPKRPTSPTPARRWLRSVAAGRRDRADQPTATASSAMPLRLFTSRNDHVVDPADSVSPRRRLRRTGRAHMAGAQLPRRHPRLRPRPDHRRALAFVAVCLVIASPRSMLGVDPQPGDARAISILGRSTLRMLRADDRARRDRRRLVARQASSRRPGSAHGRRRLDRHVGGGRRRDRRPAVPRDHRLGAVQRRPRIDPDDLGGWARHSRRPDRRGRGRRMAGQTSAASGRRWRSRSGCPATRLVAGDRPVGQLVQPGAVRQADRSAVGARDRRPSTCRRVTHLARRSTRRSSTSRSGTLRCAGCCCGCRSGSSSPPGDCSACT